MAKRKTGPSWIREALEGKSVATVLKQPGQKEPFNIQFNCLDCKVDVTNIDEQYIVQDKLWERAGMESAGGQLCIGCLEKRLERTLKHRDFNWHHILNADDMPKSRRLKNRMRRE